MCSPTRYCFILKEFNQRRERTSATGLWTQCGCGSCALPCPCEGQLSIRSSSPQHPPEHHVLDQLLTRPPSLPCVSPLLCNPKYYTSSRQAGVIADNSEITPSIPFFRSLALYSAGSTGPWIWYLISLQRSDRHLHAVCTLLICFQREDKTPNYA